jgi:hypothetical protein
LDVKFHRAEIEDFITDTRSGMLTSEWAFILEGIDYNVTEPRSDNPMKVRAGGFMILFKKKVRKNTFEERDVLMDTAEEFSDDIFRRIKRDRQRQAQQFFLFDMQSWDVKTINENTLHPDYMGLRVTFTIGGPLLLKAVNNTTWADL